VKMDPGVGRQKVANRLCFVSREIVENDVDVLLRTAFGDDLPENADELLTGVSGGGFAEYFAGLGIKSRYRWLAFLTSPLSGSSRRNFPIRAESFR